MTEVTTLSSVTPIKEGLVEEVKTIDTEKTANILFGDTKPEGEKTAEEKATAEAKAKADAEAKLKADEAAKVKDSEADKTKTEEKPIEYTDFKLPENFVADPDAIAEFKTVAKEYKLTQEQAQKLIDMQTSLAAKQSKITQEQWENVQKDWRSKSESDKEFGGAEFKANVGLAKKALDKFGTKEFREALEVTGMGNHPEIIRFLYKVGKTISEDSISSGRTTQSGNRDIAKILFPNQK